MEERRVLERGKAIASYLIGRLLQASLRAIHLGPVDTALGALLGVLTWSVAIAALLFVLDAAAFVPTASLDLTACQPDFVTLSFYKMCFHLFWQLGSDTNEA